MKGEVTEKLSNPYCLTLKRKLYYKPKFLVLDIQTLSLEYCELNQKFDINYKDL